MKDKADASFRVTLIAALLLGGLLALVAVTSSLVLRIFSRQLPYETAGLVQTNQLPPEPRLEVDPEGNLLALRRKEEALLNGYGWVDRSKGIVRIPIGRAMDLLAKRGLPVRRSSEEQ